MAQNEFSRRDFLTTAALGSAAMMMPKGVFAAGSAQIKVGVIGTGGRGTDACVNALNADPSVVIHAMGDLF
ncbi:MAG TPA: twin-arginine translocation signal domain-containing protein, partial [Fimbriimonadaceae bacterium]|nr:twin-arginine translocation signal domain-containing protein [Fimbriimonadaceae bacterium]